MVDNNDAYAPIQVPGASPIAPETPQDAHAPIQNPVPATPPSTDRQTASVAAPEASNSDSVNLVNPEGKLVSVPQGQLRQALDTGYRSPKPEEIRKAEMEDKYGGIGQQLLTGAEGAGEALTFGLSAGAERALGVDPADIAGRREVHPESHALGQIGALTASAFIPGVGAANLLGVAGEKAAAAVGLGAAEGILAKIGSSAVKGAVENAIFQSGDEAGKMLISDPAQSFSTAISNVGLASVIGGGAGAALGTVHPLWNAATGTKVGKILTALKDKVGGIEGEVPTEVSQALETTGIQVPAAVKAALSSNPEARGMFQALQESATSSGQEAQTALKSFKSEASNTMVKALGKEPEELAGLSDISEHEVGDTVKKQLIDRLKASNDPISDQFTKIKEKFKGVELGQVAKGDIEQSILKAAEAEGWNLSPSSPQAKIVNRVLEELPNVKTLDDLRKYSSVIGDSTSNPELWRVGGQLKKILRGAEESALDAHLGAEAPELLEQHAGARAAYKEQMDTIDTLNDRLHVGRYSGPGSFIKALQEMAPEDVLRRLSPKGDAGIIGELSTKFAGAADAIKNYHLDQLIRGASNAVKGEGELISSKALIKGIEKMSPEMREFILPKGAQDQINAVKTLVEALPSKINTSGTAKALDGMMGHFGSSAMGVIAALTGHNAAAVALTGGLGKVLGRDIPDAIKLGLLKFLGSSSSVDAGAFAGMVDYIDQVIKGQNLTAAAAKNVFKAGKEVLPQAFQSKESDRKKLDRKIQSLQKNPEQLLDVGGSIGHYLSEHGSAIGQTTAQVTSYLASKRPASVQINPLDRPMEPSAQAKAEYNRLLDLAQQPLTILKHVKDGTIQPNDVVNLKTMYPSMYAKLSQTLVEEMSDMVQKDELIPYQTKLGISMFLMQPLDSSMTPAGIQAAQMAVTPANQQQSPEQSSQKPPSASSTKNLTKLPGMYQTPDQARSQRGQRDR